MKTIRVKPHQRKSDRVERKDKMTLFTRKPRQGDELFEVESVEPVPEKGQEQEEER